jgi:hypothetical protein
MSSIPELVNVKGTKIVLKQILMEIYYQSKKRVMFCVCTFGQVYKILQLLELTIQDKCYDEEEENS